MSPETTDASTLVGRVIQDRFRILERIASGGMGAVYLAEQLPLGRKVALKVLEIAGENMSGRAQFQERFLLEAAAVAKLTHPNTIVLHDYGRSDDGHFFYAMELIEGTTLSKLIHKHKGLDPALTIHIASQICGSLREAHDLGLVHRDLKPGNVMLTRRGDDPHYVKVLDFGLVKVVDGELGAELTRSGIVMGSPRYMAPEQVESRFIDHRADIYAFGAVLYHMLAGRPPFVYPSQFETLRAQVDEAPPPLESKNPRCQAGPELQALTFQCLEKSAERRPQSMAEVAQRLKACAMEVGISAPSIASVDVARFARSAPHEPAAAESPNTIAATPSARASQQSMRPVGGPVDGSVEPSITTTQPSSDPTSSEPTAPSSVQPDPSRPGRRSWLVPLVAIAVVGFSVGVLVFLLVDPAPDAAAPAVVALPPQPPPAASQPPPVPPADPAPSLVELVSEPAGARVRHGDADLGDAPLALSIPAGERWELTLSLDGHEPRTITVAGTRPSVHVRLSPIEAPPPPAVRRRPRRRPPPPPTPAPQAQPLPAPEPPSPPPRRTDNRDPWAQ